MGQFIQMSHQDTLDNMGVNIDSEIMLAKECVGNIPGQERQIVDNESSETKIQSRIINQDSESVILSHKVTEDLEKTKSIESNIIVDLVVDKEKSPDSLKDCEKTKMNHTLQSDDENVNIRPSKCEKEINQKIIT